MATTITLSILALISAVFYLQAVGRGLRRQIYLLKPLTTALILGIALLAPAPSAESYKWLIVAGLIFSLAGDVFLMLPGNKFIAGWAAFLVAHLAYIAAFISNGGFYSVPWLLLTGLVYGLAIMRYLWPHLNRLRLPAAIYMLVIVVMAWQAGGRIFQGAGLSGWLAFVGAVLFVVSDSLLTVHRFARPVHNGRLIYMSAYYSAQWLIALSVVAVNSA